MNLAVIPARGGSKRIPRKNTKLFCGKPIIAYSIEAAIESQCFDQVIVSTDDEAIAEVARACGASTPFVRPTSLADDFTGTNAVVKHALSWFREQGETFSRCCCIYATAPMVQASDISQGLTRLLQSGTDFVFSVTSFPFPIQRALRLKGPAKLVEPFDPGAAATRSQDLEEAWHDAGQFYWGKAEAFLNDVPLYSEHASGLVLPRHRVQDIDTPEDWIRAELMFQALQQTTDWDPPTKAR